MGQDVSSSMREALAQLVVDGSNVLANAAGPDRYVLLRRNYLNWRQQAEDALTRAGADAPAQTERHRDIVRDAIPVDRMYVEIESETRAIQQRLEAAVEQTVQPAGRFPVSFTGDRGTQYWYDPAQLLGSPGRFGRVYAATDTAGAELAVKEVPVRTDPARRNADWALVERELQVATRASQRPGLLPLLDHARDHDRLMLIMPRADRSLADAITDGITRDDATRAIRDVADALQQLAVAGIVHRDLKPANILWWSDRWCIADFGIARLLDVTTATLTWEGTGTAEYRAPELWRGDTTTALSDLYALGCVAVEALTGHIAFPGPDHRRQHETTLPHLPDDIDPLLARTVLMLLAKQPEQRPPDARSVLQLLEPAVGLTDAHRALQRRAVAAQRRERETEAADEDHRRRGELRDRAHQSLRVLWDQLTREARRAVPDADATETQEGHFLTVADTRLAAIHAPDVPPEDLLAVADLLVNDGEGSRPQLVGNLVADAPDGLPRWRIVRWHSNDISLDRFEPGPPRQWSGLRADELARQWPRQNEAAPPLLRRFSEATPQALLDLLAETVTRAAPD